jgi:hypothetical protein
MNRRNVNDESLGIRLHEVNRQRAVERAVERMRYGLKADWDYLTLDDVANLRWLLGELWSTRNREEWEALHFSKLAFGQVRRLVGVGDRLRRHHTNKMNALESAIEIITTPGSEDEDTAAVVTYATT